jgi:nitric oxide dioxygenase
VRESEEIMSLALRPADGGGAADFESGQFIGLRLLVDGEEIRRNYSLSAASNGRDYRISVKRENGGKASNYLHDRLVIGATLELFPPAGDFVLRPSAKPLALITAGVGITPALAMLETALRTTRPIYFIHYARHSGVHAFREWLQQQAQLHPQIRLFFAYSEPRPGDHSDGIGFVSRDQLETWLPRQRDLDAYFLGPKLFMRQVKRYLKEIGVPQSQCHYEFFGPAEALEG